MNKRLLTVLSFLCFLTSVSSCKKSQSSQNSNYYIKFKINDSLVTWNNVICELGPDFIDSANTDFTMNSADKDTVDALSLSAQVIGNLPIGSYASNASNTVVFADFYTSFNTPNEIDYDIDDANGLPQSVFTINITSITPTVIKGTFTGNYLTDLFSGGGSVAITAGEFVSPRIPQ
jgi:hypothetical protein